MVQFGKDEKRDWELTLETNTIPAIRRFLAIYPNSIYAPEGLKMLDALKEEKLWEITLRQDVLFAYENYLKEYPSGKYAALAGEKIIQFEDHFAWKEACKKNTVSAYLEYKSNFPDGDFVGEVEQKITSLVKARSELGSDKHPSGITEGTDEETALEIATNEDSVSAYNQFLKQFPDGVYAEQVRKRIAQLEIHLARQYRAIEEELQAWEYADKQDSLLSYRDFLKNFPEGRYAPLARQRIGQLERKLRSRVVIKNGERVISGKGKNLIIAKEPPSPEEIKTDVAERDRQGLKLSAMWLGGFAILTFATKLLSPWYFLLSLLASLLIGVFFAYSRSLRLTRAESYLYLAGFSAISAGLCWEIFSWFTKNLWITGIFSGIIAILTLIILSFIFTRYRKSER